MNLPRQIFSFFRGVYGWLVVLLLGIAFWTRICNIGEQTLWLDEAVHLIQAKNFLRNGNLLTGNDNNGILFTVLLVPVFKVFGISIENARLLSVAFGLCSLVLIYRIANRMFAPAVGLIALTLAAFSPYLIFWSKIARNYSIFLFFCLLTIVQILDLTNGNDSKARPSFAKVSLLLLTIVAGFFSHYLMLLFTVSVAAWLLVSNRNRIAVLAKSNFKVVAATATATVIFLAGAFLFLSKNKELLAWALPNLRHLKGLYEEAPWYSLSVYSNVLLYDWEYLFVFGFLGLVSLSLNKHLQTLTFFICCLIFPFLLLSFVFREPTAARYLIFIYPFFLIVAAYGLCQTGIFLQEKVNRSFNAPNLALAISTVLLLLMLPMKNLKSVFEFSFSDNNKPDDRIIECTFSDWKQSCIYLKNRLQQRDVVIATLPQIPSVYLDRSDIVPFRQLHLDHKQKKYVPNLPDNTTKNSAQTTQNLIRTVKRNKRGWFLSDFYLESVMTDPVARKFAFQNFHFYPEASADGSVLLFGWDNEVPAPQNQNMILQVGRSDKPFSRDLTFQVPDELIRKPSIQMRYRTKFVEMQGEALLEINGFRLPLAISIQNSEVQSLEVPTKALRRGQNVFRFSYNGSPEHEKFRGYVVYYLEFVP